MKFATDIDGVLAEYHEMFVRVAKVLRRDLNVDLSKPDFFGLDQEIFNELHNKMIKLGHFETLSLTPDAEYLIDIVNPEIDEIWYLTSREAYGDNVDYLTRKVREQTVLWLHSKKLPQSENLIFTNDKGTTCAELGLSLLIEDRLEEVAKEKSRREDIDGDGVRVYLINKKWNKGHYDPYTNYDYPFRARNIEAILRRERIIE